jgi:hypothetical protein
MKLTTVNNIKGVDKLYKEFEKKALKSPQIIYSRCVYSKCKKLMLKNFTLLLDTLKRIYYNKINILHSYVPEIIKRGDALLKKNTYTDSDILQMSFYLILGVVAVSTGKKP